MPNDECVLRNASRLHASSGMAGHPPVMPSAVTHYAVRIAVTHYAVRIAATDYALRNGPPFPVAHHHPHAPRAPGVEEAHGDVAPVLLEGEVELEGGVQLLARHAFLEAPVELLDLRAGGDFGEEVLADLLLLR